MHAGNLRKRCVVRSYVERTGKDVTDAGFWQGLRERNLILYAGQQGICGESHHAMQQ
jgi:hypothetical protein